MLVTPIKTDLVRPKSHTLYELLDKSIQSMSNNTVLAITSKIVSLCEGRVAPLDAANEEDLIRQESDYYLPAELSRYGYHFSVIGNTLISVAGIDKSNAADHYILWPANPQSTANDVREYLKTRFNLKNIGVVITDSTSMPFRLGTTGVVIGYSGFKALKNYVGSPDLFGRPFEVSRANIANGLASIAVTVMGEGTEQTPLVIIENPNFVEFEDKDPSSDELESMAMTLETDLFEVFYKTVPWQQGGGEHSKAL